MLAAVEASAPAAGGETHRLLAEANGRIEQAVAERAAGRDGRAAAILEEARTQARVLAEERSLPFTLDRVEKAASWTDAEARAAVEAWGRLRRAEADPVRADLGDLTRALDACRTLGDRWCEGRTHLARAEALNQSGLTPEVREDAAAAGRILREAGPGGALARALVLLRGADTGAPPAGPPRDPAAAAARARARYAEAIDLARAAGDAETEGRALCETVRLDLNAGRHDEARAGLDRIAALARGSGEPRVGACGAYFEGLALYTARDPEGARRVWDAHAGRPDAERAPRELIWILVGAAAASLDLADPGGAAARAARGVALAEALRGEADLIPALCNLAGGLALTDGKGLREAAMRCRDLGARHGRKDAETAGTWRLGAAERLEGRYGEAERLFRQALATYRGFGNDRDAAWVLVSLGEMLIDVRRLKEARASLEEAVALADGTGIPILRSLARTSLARCQALSGDPGAAERTAEAALAAAPEWAAAARAAALKARGLARQGSRAYGGALADYREAMEIYERAGRREDQARVANDLGTVHYALNRLDLAMEEFRRAAEISRRSGSGETEAVALGNVVMLRRRFRLTEEDRALARAGVEAAERGATAGHANTLLNLSVTLAALGEVEPAERAVRRAATIARAAGDDGMERRARAALALVLSGAGRHEEALAECAAALHPAAAPAPAEGAETLRSCGEVHLAAGRPAEAAPILERALALAEAARVSLAQPELRATYMEGTISHFALLVEAVLARGGPDPPAAAVEEAFLLSERFRARSLLEALASRDDRPAPSDASRPREEILARMAELHLRGAGPGDEEGVRVLKEIRALEARWAEIAGDPAGPGRDPLLGGAASDLDAARARLGGGAAALEYLTTRRWTFLFVLAREGARVLRLPGWGDWADDLVRFRGLLERRGALPGRDEEAIRILGERLFNILIAPARDVLPAGVHRLLIAPEGPLHLLPFEALVVPGGTPSGPPRYLVRDFEVALVPSLGVLEGLRRRPAPGEADGGLLAFANPDLSRLGESAWEDGTAPEGREAASSLLLPRALPPLPHSEEEIRRAARHLGGAAVIRTGSHATEAAVREGLAAGHGIVHLAAHGFLDSGSHGRSGLLMTPDPAAGDDGLLQAREIVDSPVRADLVILSGCSTGGGGFVRGEGFVGLPHALFQAGARRIVMTLWQVRDRSATVFMERLYEGLASGQPLAAAVRRAKLDLLDAGREELRHPSVWAPFVVAGVADEPVRVRAAPGGARSRRIPAAGAAAAACLVAAIALALLGHAVSRRRPRSAG
jgi:CHAT domain-containing protein/tetratricopeptide (TPR) repeat protein